MVKPLTFKGDKPKKRKHTSTTTSTDGSHPSKKQSTSTSLTTQQEDPSATEHHDENTLSDQSWVSADTSSDISGPILLILRTTPPTCLATDAHGTVFASPLENMIEGDPRTAEPHDVRQVWIASKIAGIEGWSLKGSNGRYLTSDKHGIMSANASAISQHEIYTINESGVGGGGFFKKKKKVNKQTYIVARTVASKTTASGTKVEVRGDETNLDDGEEGEGGTNIRVRMQARFKPRIQASKEIKAREKIGRKELEGIVGRRLDDDEVKRLRKARKEGDFHEVVLDVRVRGKHDKFA
ncbi:uncharacterized protein BO87DRAFT_353890 [Aspergillus neoniger CBS 115656]|uniref:FRG1-like family protein n=1 Tax=Aspergillus neoniger (strain CBS 115656) TaxID=1448310 RepID=A0A318YUX2_ASPNB|nr:hypothetical protein BO87DRAFT_353890 [Aspergillus neoniger CBS 115656]PYH36643.1 hypothetical protein BO87DRAFT_353890 [Aspergillus neoniger CBS 115656]